MKFEPNYYYYDIVWCSACKQILLRKDEEMSPSVYFNMHAIFKVISIHFLTVNSFT